MQELPDHADVRMTMIYAHVLIRGGGRGRSPVEDFAPDRPTCRYAVSATV